MKHAWAFLELVWALTVLSCTFGWIVFQFLVMLPIAGVLLLLMILTASALGILKCIGVPVPEAWFNDVGEAGPWILQLLWGPNRHEDDP
jgi:hypothetical protein